MNNENKKMVEIPLEEFQELVNKVKQCESAKEKLLDLANRLNDQITSYNSQYAKDKK